MRRIGSPRSPNNVIIVTLALALTLGACHRGPGQAVEEPGPTSSPTVITQEELDRATYASAYDAIRHLRPQMLRQRGVNTINGHNIDTPIVYLDNRLLGPLEHLHHIAPGTLGRIEFFSPAEAQFRWGFGHPAGVIMLSSREYQPPITDPQLSDPQIREPLHKS